MSTVILRLLRHKKVGGLHFIRVGRYSLSFCRCRKAPVRLPESIPAQWERINLYN